MGRFSEYINLISKAVDNPDAILNGWVNDLKLKYGYLKEDEVEEIVRRRAICYSCPLFSENLKKDDSKYQELLSEPFITDRKDEHCGICGCFMEKKTASLLSNCGLEFYNSNNPQNIQELKWKSYKTNGK